MKRTSLTITFVCIAMHFVFSQQVDFSPYPGFNAVCPQVITDYSITSSPKGCNTYSWTVTNGRFYNNVSTGSTVSVLWDDEPKIGKLKVTTTCGDNTYTEEKEYIIRSVKGETPANARAYQILPFCSTATINVAVDPMMIPNTGGSSPVPVKYVDGYEWDLPEDWTLNGVSGKVYTTSEFVSITPDDGCAGGVISVKGVIEHPCFVSQSNAATISVNRQSLSISVTPPSGYVGPRCGAKAPVTFTATPVSCASNYVWTFPSGWHGPNGELSPYKTIANSVALTPSGDPTDGGTIKATVHLDCGSNLPGSYTANYVEPNPVVSGAGTVCAGGTTFSVSSAPNGSAVTWSSSPNISINSSSGFATASGGGTGTITANIATPCGNFVRTKSVWVGSPTDTGLDMAVMSGPGPVGNQLCWDTEMSIGAINTNHTEQRITQYNWNFSSWSTYFTGYEWSPLGSRGIAKFVVNSTTPSPRLMSLRARNACGLSPQLWETFYALNCQGGPGGWLLASAYPIPADGYLTIALDPANEEETFVQLYDSFSNPVFKTQTTEHQLVIPVRDFPEGMYYLHIYNGKEVKKQRIQIAH